MATVALVESPSSDVKVLHGVPYAAYLAVIADPKNRHVRLAYHDGTLEIVSPILYAHEGPSRRFSALVVAVARALGMRCLGSGSMTIYRKGAGPTKGVGKEPDMGFYLASIDRFPRHRPLDLNAGDPPPDLWIEVDNRVSSKGRLPVYARLGVPEVWQYRVATKSLQFLGLTDGKYIPMKRSRAFPVLSPERALEVIGPGVEMEEIEFLDFLDGWVPNLIARAAGDPPP